MNAEDKEVVSEWEGDGQPPGEDMQTDGAEDDPQLEETQDGDDSVSDMARLRRVARR